MKFVYLIALSLFLVTTQQNTNDTNELIGKWKIDLRPTPKSPKYFQFLRITEINDRTFEGSFYGSSIKDGLINTEWEKIYFSFTTSDASNVYYHSGYLLEDKLYGVSYCPGRSLVSPWTGEK